MKQVLIAAAASAAAAGLLSATVSQPMAWIVGLAGIAGSTYLGRRRRKPSIAMVD